MSGLTEAYEILVLDSALLFPVSGASDYIGYSTNGYAETTGLARTPVGATGWGPALDFSPVFKANNTLLTSAGATAVIVITHYAIFTALTAGLQKIDWTPLAHARTLAIDGSVQWLPGSCRITLV